MKKPIDIIAEANHMRDLCARSEYCTDDILQRLIKRGASPAEANKIVSALVDERFIDNYRFARAFVRDKYRFSGWGRNKIATALYAKRIPAALVAKAISEISLRKYATTAMQVMRSRLKLLSPDLKPIEKRQKLYRFGISRGYEPQLIIKILNSSTLWASPDDLVR